MNFEDHFSELAKTYSQFRPNYPSELFEYLSSLCRTHELAWDCGTGNGQAAVKLAEHFNQVIATDASGEQINHAAPHPKILYKIEKAEEASLRDNSIDLVTVAAAVHWFDFDKFYEKVRNVLKPEGIIAVWAYSRLLISPDTDDIIRKYMYNVLIGHWPERFEYVSKEYENLPFPFDEIEPPDFELAAEWDLLQLAGFLNSWSGTKNYLNKTGRHPLNEIWDELKAAWGDEKIKYMVRLPLNIRIGKMQVPAAT